ncbi:hypothetical protein NKR23_g12481 [Pleurostoma richardsiae]|uniref:Uncharacterized protein n=1 Tax=Pleurostoma richardsiae TaxID=41990 RepID=A0AA38VFV4_9PEZI|nr:hypothetical protein NKR23_g12481 [Pleurostoma richardsiae]
MTSVNPATVASRVESERLRKFLGTANRTRNLEFPPDVRLTCLHGRAAVKAAEEVFDDEDGRWLVNLYLPDISPELRTSLAERYDYDAEPDDGEFFCRIREYQGVLGEPNAYLENEWWARLLEKSPSRRQRFDQLFNHECYLSAFTRLLEAGLEGLFGGFRASVMHEVIASGCEIECISYIDSILDFFRSLFAKSNDRMRRLSRGDVMELQGKAPGAFPADAQDLIGKLKTRQILTAYSEEERDEIWSGLCAMTKERSIPSIFTFFEDTKFLRTAGVLMKRLMPQVRTISLYLRTHMFQDKNQKPDDGASSVPSYGSNEKKKRSFTGQDC